MNGYFFLEKKSFEVAALLIIRQQTGRDRQHQCADPARVLCLIFSCPVVIYASECRDVRVKTATA